MASEPRIQDCTATGPTRGISMGDPPPAPRRFTAEEAVERYGAWLARKTHLSELQIDDRTRTLRRALQEDET